jgi:hypothetical protein
MRLRRHSKPEPAGSAIRQTPDIRIIAAAVQVLLENKTPESIEGLSAEIRESLKGLFKWLGTEAKRSKCKITTHAARAIAISMAIPKKPIPIHRRLPDDGDAGYAEPDFKLALTLMGDDTAERDEILQELIIINPELGCPIRDQLGRERSKE